MLPKRILGQTAIEVSVLGLGTVKFGRNQRVKYPTPFSLPSDADLRHLLSLASAHGINLLDTAPAYGSSEERLGKLLQGRRQQWVISTKVGEEFIEGQSYFDFSAPAMIHSIERSLKRLNTDYLDIVLIHSNGNDESILEQAVFDTLDMLKTAGKIRAYGMSTKTVAGGMLTLQHADVAMIAFHPDYTDEADVIRYAHQHQKGIFIKKAFASGYLSPDKSLPFIFSQVGVTSIMMGTINPLHLKNNIKIAMDCF